MSADLVSQCQALVLALEALGEDPQREPERGPLEFEFNRAIGRLNAETPEAQARWVDWCIDRRDTPGRWHGRPLPSLRCPHCVGFGCDFCNGWGLNGMIKRKH